MSEKNKKIVIGIAIAVGVVLLCALCYFASSAVSSKAGDSYSENLDTTTSSDVENMTTRAQEESANVSEDEKKDFKDIDVDEYVDLYEDSKNSVVLFASPSCGYCQVAEPILHHIAYQYDLTIYHVDVSALSADESEELADSNDYFSQLGTPALLVVSNGEIVDSVDGLVDTDSYVDFLKDNGFIKE